MCERIKPRNNGKRVARGLICRGITHILVLAFLFPFWSPLAPGARANDLTSTDNVVITLFNRVEMLFISGEIPVAGKHQFNIFLSPEASDILSAGTRIATAGSKRTEMPRTSGKLMIAGGVGKRILTVSAEMYDSDTHSWLTKGNLAIGRGQHVLAIPFNGRVLVWAGIIVPF
jgi:hypothetical protein